MKCAPDIARLLAKICCIHGALPTGSPISPTLSYFACEDMFSWIGNLARSNNLCFSLYVDDMFFSGETASQELRNKVITHLKKKRPARTQNLTFPCQQNPSYNRSCHYSERTSHNKQEI